MGQSVLVFISHSSEDKESIIEPLARDLEECYINVWLDKRKIVPGDNLRKSIFRDGLDKADIALIFFTENSLKSSWVDREIKHVLRDELKAGNNFDLRKIISIFDTKETYAKISERYPELTDDLLHLMPNSYGKTELGQLISAIWSKYLTLQGGDIETQRQLLAKDKEIFQRDKDIQALKEKLDQEKIKSSKSGLHDKFESYLNSGALNEFVKSKEAVLTGGYIEMRSVNGASTARAFGLIEEHPRNNKLLALTDKGREFLEWYILTHKS